MIVFFCITHCKKKREGRKKPIHILRVFRFCIYTFGSFEERSRYRLAQLDMQAVTVGGDTSYLVLHILRQQFQVRLRGTVKDLHHSSHVEVQLRPAVLVCPRLATDPSARVRRHLAPLEVNHGHIVRDGSATRVL